MKLLALLFLIVASLECGAVSRVGGGKVSSLPSGFEMTIASSFNVGDNGNGVRANGPPTYFSGLGFISQFFEISEFSSDFSSDISLGKEDLQNKLLANGWQPLQTNQPCALGFSKTNSQVTAYVVTWGSGKGFVIKGLTTHDVKAAMNSALGSLQVQQTPDGGCPWK